MTLTFKPDWVSPPGDTIADLLEEKDWSQAHLAEKLEYTSDHVSQLINGKSSITEEVAVKLAKVLGGTKTFWLNREANYRLQLNKIE
jgi:HTH-type transcriptional regulator / antitoxin HigA